MSEYVSSIIFRYGDTDKVRADSKTIHEIISRQGSNLIVDCLAEYVGRSVNKHNLSSKERRGVAQAIVKDLEDALMERI